MNVVGPNEGKKGTACKMDCSLDKMLICITWLPVVSRPLGLCGSLNGPPPTHKRGVCSDDGLWGRRCKGGNNQNLERVGPPREGGKDSLEKKDSVVYTVSMWSIDGEEPKLKATHVEASVVSDRGASHHMSKEKERVVDGNCSVSAQLWK